MKIAKMLSPVKTSNNKVYIGTCNASYMTVCPSTYWSTKLKVVPVLTGLQYTVESR